MTSIVVTPIAILRKRIIRIIAIDILRCLKNSFFYIHIDVIYIKVIIEKISPIVD